MVIVVFFVRQMFSCPLLLVVNSDSVVDAVCTSFTVTGTLQATDDQAYEQDNTT